MAASATRPCPFCLSEIPAEARKCRHCGEWVEGPPGEAAKTGDQSVRRFFESEDLKETLNIGVKWYVKYQVVMFVVGLIVFLIFASSVCTRDAGPDPFVPGLGVEGPLGP